MVVDQNDMIKLENFDLQRDDKISTTVSFSDSLIEPAEMEMKFNEPRLKKSLNILNIELSHGATGSRKGLF